MTDVVKTQIFTASGKVFKIEGGYLDIGLLDTMKDLFVNFIGAIVFCIFGFIYLRSDSKKKLATTVVEGLRIEPVPVSGDAADETGSSAEQTADHSVGT